MVNVIVGVKAERGAPIYPGYGFLERAPWDPMRLKTCPGVGGVGGIRQINWVSPIPHPERGDPAGLSCLIGLQSPSSVREMIAKGW